MIEVGMDEVLIASTAWADKTLSMVWDTLPINTLFSVAASIAKSIDVVGYIDDVTYDGSLRTSSSNLTRVGRVKAAPSTCP